MGLRRRGWLNRLAMSAATMIVVAGIPIPDAIARIDLVRSVIDSLRLMKLPDY